MSFFLGKPRLVSNAGITKLILPLNKIVSLRNCEGVSEIIDTFYDISLPITKKKSTLTKCLDSFFKEEGWIDSYKCEKCKMNSQAKKTVVVCEQPKILVLHLKRFKMFPKRQKLFNPVEFPMDEPILKQYDIFIKIKNKIFYMY